MDITKEYYSAVDFAVSRIVEFIRGLEASEEFITKGEECLPGLVRGKDAMFLFQCDLVRCYKELGHDLDVRRKESLALHLSYTQPKMSADDYYNMLDGMILLTADKHNEVSSVIWQQLSRLPDNCSFIVHLILDRILGSDDLKKRYSVLLYRLCSVIAKADGTITPEESRWLAHLLKISDSKDEEASTKLKATDKAQAYFSRKATQDSINDSAAIRELDSLIGLEGVKKEVHTLANFAVVQKMREEKGLKATPLSMHLVFSGNPGTGKTTVARIMGRIYKDLGLLETGHLVEADRSSLVAEYVGQTAVKTNKIIDSALGGVLFIDEAYSLVNGSREDFGAEAISTLLKRMEDSRDKLAVILAGYTDRMDEFISSNPGLNSRFSRKIEFADYSAEELHGIFESLLDKYDYMISDDADEKVREVMEREVARKTRDFGNGRFARNLFERIIEAQANRVAFLAESDEMCLCTIELPDIENL